MRIINNSKEITTLEVGDKVVFGNLEYEVRHADGYFLYGLGSNKSNNKIFTILGLSTIDFVKNLGIETLSVRWIFPEVKSLEALTAIVSALFKEYEKQNELPKTWEEFCENTPIQKGECLINAFSEIKKTISVGDNRNADEDRTYFTSVQEAKAFLALMQLRQLRKAYVKDWEPDWADDTSPKYCIDLQNNDFSIHCWYHMHSPLSFSKCELAAQFLNNFKDLLEIAKPLL